ncbi:MAG: transposase [Roseobacter sp.]
MHRIATLLGIGISVPYFSTLSRLGKGLTLPATHKSGRSDRVHLVVDSTRLKVFGAGEWLEQKHKARRKWRSWRKLNLGFVSGEIVFSDLTKDDVGDPTATARLAEPCRPARNALSSRRSL